MRELLHRVEEGLIALILAAMTLLTFVQVVLRYVFNTGLNWAFEATTYLFAWLVLIGIAYGVRVHAHIGIDILVKALPSRPRRVVGLIVVALSLAYAGLMFYGSWNYTARMMKLGVTAEDIHIQRWILGLCLPIGFGLLFARLMEAAWSIMTGKAPGFELADEAAEALAHAEAEREGHGR